MIEFPKDFFWGAATSSYQVEGNNSNCDWWEWEKRSGLKELSGAACRHYELFRQDFDLAKSLEHNAHRISLEWSRIEPEQGKFSESQINHYWEVISALKERGLEPVVTLHHFTNPLWFSRLGGWENKKASGYFLGFVEKMVSALGSQVLFWITINEPMVYVYQSYLMGFWPPQKKSLLMTRKVALNLAQAHIKAYGLIHELSRKNNFAFPQVSVASNLRVFSACAPTLKNRFAVYLRDRAFNFDFLDILARNNSLDFIGVNYYSRDLIDLNRWGISSLLVDTCRKGHDNLRKNSLGWEIYPEGLAELLIRLKKYELPVFILENGICTDDDALRWDFIREHLFSLHKAISQGVKVLGYIYWSLLDNFEWDKGFGPRFGLVEVDYSDFRRTVRESARKFSAVCKSGKLE